MTALEHLDFLTFIKPAAYDRLDVEGAEGYFKANQRVLPWLEKLVKQGESQLKDKTGYSDNKLPPIRNQSTSVVIGECTVTVSTNVRIQNPSYANAFQQLMGYLDSILFDVKEHSAVKVWQSGDEKQPYLRWDYLMTHATRCISNVQRLGIVEKIAKVEGPERLDQSLERLVVPRTILNDFNVTNPQTMEVWYTARNFVKEVKEGSVKPVKEELKEKYAGSTLEKTAILWQQVESTYAFGLKATPSPRREPGKILLATFQIPVKLGKKDLPVIATPDTFLSLLSGYKQQFIKRIEKRQKLVGKMGSLSVLHYAENNNYPENHPYVQAQFPDLQMYDIRRDSGVPYVNIQKVAIHLAEAGAITKPRLLTQVVTQPLV